jgi:hypothetical protein
MKLAGVHGHPLHSLRPFKCKGFSRGMQAQASSSKQPSACAAPVPATGRGTSDSYTDTSAASCLLNTSAAPERMPDSLQAAAPAGALQLLLEATSCCTGRGLRAAVQRRLLLLRLIVQQNCLHLGGAAKRLG